MGLTKEIKNILAGWALSGPGIGVTQLQTGHIHQSFQVNTSEESYFLQRLNTEVFVDPNIIVANLDELRKVTFYGEVASLPPYLPTAAGQPYFRDSEGAYWRMFPWIDSAPDPGSETRKQRVYRTSNAFGTWTENVNVAIQAERIRHTLPGFHHLTHIVDRFQQAWNASSGNRKLQASETCSRLSEGSFVLDVYKQLVTSLPLRIIHGDAKSDNILTEKGDGNRSWVIDLDTVMPGYLWMDVGDMIRSMACTFPESSEQLDQIHIEPQIVETILEGYYNGIGNLANPLEIESLRLGPCCIIYEQAIRFLTDFLKGDSYYPVSYPDENLVRAQNQLLLWESYWDYLDHKTGLSSL